MRTFDSCISPQANCLFLSLWRFMLYAGWPSTGWLSLQPVACSSRPIRATISLHQQRWLAVACLGIRQELARERNANSESSFPAATSLARGAEWNKRQDGRRDPEGAHLQRCRSLRAQILRSFRPSFLCASAAHFVGMKPPGGHDLRFDGARQEINRGSDQSHGIRHGRWHDRHAFEGGLALQGLTSRATHSLARSEKGMRASRLILLLIYQQEAIYACDDVDLD